MSRRTIDGTSDAAVLGAAKTRNNGRYNGNGRHWETPPEVFGPLNSEFRFTLDPCATHKTAKCSGYFTEEIDGLAHSWGQHSVFMNPPYGAEIYAWTRKAREASRNGALVVGLLPASTDLPWWHEDVMGAPKSRGRRVASGPCEPPAEVRYIRGRVRFLTGGPYRASAFQPSVIVIWYPRGLVMT